MRVSSFIPVILSAAPALVSAAGNLGWALGAKNPDGSCKSTSDYQDDFKILKETSSLVRIYAASQCDTAANILPAAKSHGVKVVLGIWPDTDESFEADVEALKETVPGNEDVVYGITCGSETLYRGNFTGDELLEKIQTVQELFPEVPVGTADSWNKYADGTADALIKGGVKLLMVNAFAYWQAQDIKNATATYFDDTMQAIARIQEVASCIDCIHVMTGETGWPTDGGSDYGAAKAGTQNAKTFYQQGVCAMLDWGVDVFYFEAFDEPWKPKSVGDDGSDADETHWGAYTAYNRDANALEPSTTIDASKSRDISNSGRLLAQSTETDSSRRPPESTSNTLHPGSASPSSDGVSRGESETRRILSVAGVESPPPPSAFDFAVLSPPRPLISPPTLPYLRRFPDSRRLLATPSPTRHARSDSSAYYTADWDWESPYATPESRLPSSRKGSHSPDRRFENESPTYMRSHRQVTAEGLVRDSEGVPEPPSPSSNRPRPEPRRRGDQRSSGTIQGFTEDWIRQYISTEHHSERNNWLSDDSAEGDDRRTNYPASSSNTADDDWLGLGDNTAVEEIAKTPTLARFLRRKERARSGDFGSSQRASSGHKANKSTAGFPQSAFWDFLRPSDGSSPAAPEKPSTKMELDENSLPTDKALPAPPSFERTSSEPPIAKESPGGSPSTRRPTLQSMPSTSRNKKKIAWRGKTCVISLPSNETRSLALLTPGQVEARFKKWEEEGYNTSGFSLLYESTTADPPAAEGQSRPVYPSLEDVKTEWRERKYRVVMPDLKKWEEYVTSLQEEKLKALGVSFGDDDAPRKKSPVSAAMSRSSSQFPPNTTSPPFPPSSVASNHVVQNHTMFSPPFNPSTNPSSHVGSVASPGLQFAGQHANGHIPKQSIAIPGNDRSYGSPFQFPLPQPTPPIQASRSPQHYFGSRPESGSPAIQPNLQSLGAVLSPSSPASFDGIPQNGAELVARLRQQHMPSQSVHQVQLQNQFNPGFNIPQTTGTPEPQRPPIVSNRSNLDIAHPTPQGHRHNVSETLQKEIDDAEYHLEESMRRELEQEEEQFDLGSKANDLAKSRWADFSSLKPQPAQNAPYSKMPNDNVPLKQPVESLTELEKDDGDLDGSDLDTNPSLSGENIPKGESEPSTRPSYQKHGQKPSLNAAAAPFEFKPGHKSQTSNLKVGAQEFKFNPQSSFTPGNFSFTSSPFQPDLPKFNPSASTFQPGPHLNVAAPTFTPQTQPTGTLPTGEFSFSSAFNVDAAPFDLPRSFTSDTGLSGRSSAEEPSKGPAKIFGNIELPSTSGAVRRSKAIPIVRPDTDVPPDKDGMQIDEEGRLAPSLSRQKRARRGADDGDNVPVFATPTPLNETAQAPSPHRDTTNVSPTRSQGKENVEPHRSSHAATDVPPVIIPEQKEVSKETPETASATWSPFEFRNRKDAADFNSARPISSSPGKHGKLHISKSVEYLTEDESKALLRDSSPADSDHRRNLAVRSPGSISPLSASAIPFAPASSEPQFEYISGLSDEGEGEHEVMDETKVSNLAHSAADSVPSNGSETQTFEVQNEPTAEAIGHDEAPPLESDNAERPQELAPGHDHIEAQEEPSFEEIDDVMKHINHEASDPGVEQTPASWIESSPAREAPAHLDLTIPKHPLHPSNNNNNNTRSDAPSPSPRRIQQLYGHPPHRESTDIDQSRSDNVELTGGFGLGINTPVHRLNKPEDAPVSDWDDALYSEDEPKLQHRSQFFDSHVNNIIGGVLQSRLGPLENAMQSIQQAVNQLANRSTSRHARRSLSAELEDSDADDEDDEQDRAPPRRSTSSRGRSDRKVDDMKAIMLDALATHHETVEAPRIDLARIHEVLAEMKLLADPIALENQKTELKGVMEEVISTHPRLRGNRAAGDQNTFAEKLKLQTDGLESMLRIANERAEEESCAKRALETELAEIKKSLQHAEEEAAQHRESAEEAERSLRLFHEDKQLNLHAALDRTSALQEEVHDLQTTTSQLKEKNTALESTLDEYRLSSDDWRQELDEVKNKNVQLLKTIEKTKHQLEENVDANRAMKAKLTQLQDEIVAARRDIAQEESSWRRREQDLVFKHETLQARFDREVKSKEILEVRVEQLQVAEQEGMKAKFALGQSQQEIVRLEEMITKLREQSLDHQANAARFEREFNDARESARMEVQRTRSSLEADIEAANNQVNMVRNDLEGEISRLQAQIENVKLDADTQNAQHELLLEEANDAKRLALSEAAQNREAAMQEQHRINERALNDLRERHARALHNASEDRQRIETHLSEQLALQASKNSLLEDKIHHLEERLEIAKSAAAAAVQAAKAQSGKLPETTTLSHSRSTSSRGGSMSAVRGSDLPEKISPQALRESILSLTEQLHERESRIDQLEHQLSAVDKDAPAKVKDRDTEIAWLRELLGVRIDDLQDIITTLSEPDYDRDAVRDAAIRLRANLQMEQQEKERMQSGVGNNGQRFPPLDLISNLASPRGALGRGATMAMERLRDSSISSRMPDMAAMKGETPSRLSSGAQSFFNWVSTPTAGGAQRRPSAYNLATPSGTVTTLGGRKVSTESRPLGAYNAQRTASTRTIEKMPDRAGDGLATPPLLRKSSYDTDAESAVFELGPSFYGAAGVGGDENRRPLAGYSVTIRDGDDGEGGRDGLFSP